MANITSTTIKKGIASNGYTAQKLGFDNRRPFNLGLSSQKSESSPFKATEGEYYYKIGGKSVTKAEYNAYENPVGDGPTKSTNDPDASGRIARTQEARKKNTASKRPTVLTKEQTKLKDQGTKIKKRPPFKKMKKKSPMKNKFLNRIQQGLSVAGMAPVIGNVADIANTAVSGVRAGYAKSKGDTKGAKKHLANMAINATSAIPGLGLAAGGAKLARAGVKAAKSNKSLKAIKEIKGAKDLATKTAKNVKKESVKRSTKMVAKEDIGSRIDTASTKKTRGNVVRSKKNFAGKSPLKPKSTKANKPTFKTGLEGITSKKVA